MKNKGTKENDTIISESGPEEMWKVKKDGV